MPDELTMQELDAATGAGQVFQVPGGTLTRTPGGGTIMKFGNVSIGIGADGAITTSQTVPAPN
jgi:hypothetical protein